MISYDFICFDYKWQWSFYYKTFFFLLHLITVSHRLEFEGFEYEIMNIVYLGSKARGIPKFQVQSSYSIILWVTFFVFFFCDIGFRRYILQIIFNFWLLWQQEAFKIFHSLWTLERFYVSTTLSSEGHLFRWYMLLTTYFVNIYTLIAKNLQNALTIVYHVIADFTHWQSLTKENEAD